MSHTQNGQETVNVSRDLLEYTVAYVHLRHDDHEATHEFLAALRTALATAPQVPANNDQLATAIYSAAVKAGIIKNGTNLTGPQCLLLLNDLIHSKQQVAPQVPASESGYHCFDCKAPLQAGYDCSNCGSFNAEENDAVPQVLALTDGKINEITYDKLGKWPSFEAQSWACKVVHTVLANIAPQVPATPTTSNSTELEAALETLDGIVNSDWREWQELASASEFERWVKARANHAAVQIRAATVKQVPAKADSKDAIKFLRKLKSDLMHIRRFGDDSLASKRNACTNAEFDIEEFLAAAKDKP